MEWCGDNRSEGTLNSALGLTQSLAATLRNLSIAISDGSCPVLIVL